MVWARKTFQLTPGKDIWKIDMNGCDHESFTDGIMKSGDSGNSLRDYRNGVASRVSDGDICHCLFSLLVIMAPHHFLCS